MKTLILFFLLSPLFSLAQGNGTTDVDNPVQIKSFTTSAGTFKVEYNNSAQRTIVPDKIYFIESTTKTSDGGTSIYVINREAYEESLETAIAENEILVTIVPNPFNTVANFVINTDEDVRKVIVEVYDVFGKMVKSISMQTLTFSFEKNNLSDGFYFLKTRMFNENGEEKITIDKFIINSN